MSEDFFLSQRFNFCFGSISGALLSRCNSPVQCAEFIVLCKIEWVLTIGLRAIVAMHGVTDAQL